eukprot:Clim_evm86s150 gene=Clim_evmTU86s150
MEFELKGVATEQPKDFVTPSALQGNLDQVQTRHGVMHVRVEGEKGRPVMVTLPEQGVSNALCFGTLMNFPPMRTVMSHMQCYHLDFPGFSHESGPWPRSAPYPSMEQFAEMVADVLDHYDLRFVYCYGIGAGANIFVRLATVQPSRISGLLLQGFLANAETYFARAWNYATGVQAFDTDSTHASFRLAEVFVEQYFSRASLEAKVDMIDAYRSELSIAADHGVLQRMYQTWQARDDISARVEHLKCRTILIIGKESLNQREYHAANKLFTPSITTTYRVSDGADMIQEENPASVFEGIRLFLVGGDFPAGMKRELMNLAGEVYNYMNDVSEPPEYAQAY